LNTPVKELPRAAHQRWHVVADDGFDLGRVFQSMSANDNNIFDVWWNDLFVWSRIDFPEFTDVVFESSPLVGTGIRSDQPDTASLLGNAAHASATATPRFGHNEDTHEPRLVR
jgi:hypothetical protein